MSAILKKHQKLINSINTKKIEFILKYAEKLFLEHLFSRDQHTLAATRNNIFYDVKLDPSAPLKRKKEEFCIYLCRQTILSRAEFFPHEFFFGGEVFEKINILMFINTKSLTELIFFRKKEKKLKKTSKQIKLCKNFELTTYFLQKIKGKKFLRIFYLKIVARAIITVLNSL